MGHLRIHLSILLNKSRWRNFNPQNKSSRSNSRIITCSLYCYNERISAGCVLRNWIRRPGVHTSECSAYNPVLYSRALPRTSRSGSTRNQTIKRLNNCVKTSRKDICQILLSRYYYVKLRDIAYIVGTSQDLWDHLRCNYNYAWHVAEAIPSCKLHYIYINENVMCRGRYFFLTDTRYSIVIVCVCKACSLFLILPDHPRMANLPLLVDTRRNIRIRSRNRRAERKLDRLSKYTRNINS